MKYNLYQIDAFTDTIFGGNPACVVPLDHWLPDDVLLKIAKENAVAETAFFVDKGDTFVEDGVYKLNFPSRMPVEADLPLIISNSLNIQPKEILKSRDYVLVYDNETDIRNIKIDRQAFDQINLAPGGMIVTAKGDNCDFVSRFFTPQTSILEDPVTGSAHCSLIPFWAKRLDKKVLYAQQVSERMGKLYCEDLGERVIISGQAKTYSIGNFWIN